MTKTETTEGAMAEYVTAVIGGQLFGLPISRVQDVFMPERLTRVPLASSEIAGVLNLRGRIVTVVDMRARLGLPKADDGKPMAVGVDQRGGHRGKVVVVSHHDLIHADRVVFIHDRDDAGLKERTQCASGCDIPPAVRQAVIGQQNLPNVPIHSLECVTP